jgi:hypothetical protein
MQNYGENKEIRSVFLKLYIFFKKNLHTHKFQKDKKEPEAGILFPELPPFFGL